MESKCFDHALDEQLIDLVRMHPALYQSSHISYKENAVKESVWDEIALSLDRTVSECKTRWRTIRDSYRKTQKRLQMGCRTKSKYNTENLKFLERVTKYSLEGPISPSHNEPNELISHENSELPDFAVEVETGAVDRDSKSHENKGDDHDTERDKTVISRGFQRSETLSKANTSLKPVIQKKKRPKLAKEKIHEEIKKEHEDRKRISKDLLSEEKSDTPEHPVEMFFRSMAKIVMTFPPHLIAETRNKVCSIISEMELRSIAEQNTPGCAKCHNL